MTTAARVQTDSQDAWADLSGRWFFAWRMAAACEDALREVHLAMDRAHNPSRVHALEKVSLLLRRELVRWVRRGEALDMIVDRLPRQPE
ncbi:MAG TPA: hypothetical protein VFT91_08380 [Dehalococcoidia bacterium]|nr:hypothetical protein [Dehalococcoidia bacterium]